LNNSVNSATRTFEVVCEREHIHKNTDISIESVINNFSLANRKLDFVLRHS